MSLLFSLAYTGLLGSILSTARGRGVYYSIIAIGGSLGWAFGGLLAGLLYSGGLALLAASALIAAGFAAALPVSMEASSERPSLTQLLSSLRGSGALTSSVVASQAALLIFFNSAALKLKSELGDPIKFGIVFTTLTAVVSAAVRPLAGKLSDVVGHERLLLLSNAAYIPMCFGITVLSGAALIALWLVPLYPFRDVALSMSVSTRLPANLQGTAAGVIVFANSFSGLLSIVLSPVLRGLALEGVLLVILPLLSLSILLLAIDMRSSRLV
jgi:MFS family permease